jgi:hypothetical protein
MSVMSDRSTKTLKAVKVVPECMVCVEPLNKSTRKPVHCEFCEFSACRVCTERHLLTRTEPQCMDCGKAWSRPHLAQAMTVKFMTTEYRAHREKIAFSKERLLLPAAQERMMEIRANKQLANTLIAEYHVMTEALRTQHAVIQRLSKAYNAIILKPNPDVHQRQRYADQIAVEHNRHNQINLEMHHMRTRIIELRAGRADPSDNTRHRRALHRACPQSECKGFLDENWECGLCSANVCPHCRVLITGAHSCSPNDMESAKVIDAETRACPKCSVGIYKLDGCDQMWCTQCHTAFSWRTGAIETKIHNPHYHEWRRQNAENGRQAGEVQCGRALDQEFVNSMRRISNRLFNPAEMKSVMDDLTGMFSILRLFGLLIGADEDAAEAQFLLRTKFLHGRMTDEEFQKAVLRKEDEVEYTRELVKLYDTFVHAMVDILYRLASDLRDMAVYDEFEPPVIDIVHSMVRPRINIYKREMRSLVDYINACFKETATAYRLPPKKIDL